MSVLFEDLKEGLEQAIAYEKGKRNDIHNNTIRKISMKPDWVFSPQPMYIIGTKNEDGSPNFCIVTWLGFSYDGGPNIMMTMGGTKLTKTNILRDRKFSANLVSEDNLWLADYFGNTNGEEGIKGSVSYSCQDGKFVDVPVLDECHWTYECEVTKIIELDGSHLFLASIKNIQIDEACKTMDMKKIDLRKLRPAIYAPYNYFSIGEKLGEMGEWDSHITPEEYINSQG